VDGRPYRRNKAACSNSFGVVWAGPYFPLLQLVNLIFVIILLQVSPKTWTLSVTKVERSVK